MPHISECLMKRSLKPTDLRDMTLGQLQVIVNDLHSQIESEWQRRWETKGVVWGGAGVRDIQRSTFAEMSKRA